MLTIERSGVRVWLHAARVEGDAARLLERMWLRRKFGTPESTALAAGWHATRREYEQSVRELVDRGGLLHLWRVHVERTAAGEYNLTGAAC